VLMHQLLFPLFPLVHHPLVFYKASSWQQIGLGATCVLRSRRVL
jgi:hypothetical protein